MVTTVFDALIKKLNEHKSSATEFMADGGCKDYTHYRNLCGVIQGLSLAQREIIDLARNFLEDEDD